MHRNRMREVQKTTMIETILSNFHLEKIFYIIKKRIALMLVVGAICGAFGGAYAFFTNVRTYTATTSYYVYSNPDYANDTSVNISGADFSTAKALVQSYLIVLKSDTVMKAVIDDLGISYSPSALAGMISYQMVEDTAIFNVYVNNTDPQVAMDIANAIADIAPEHISGIVKSGGIEVIDYATLPTTPYSSTSVVKFGILGFVGGFGIVAVVSLFLGLLDTTIRRKYEIRDTYNIPILGDVPLLEAEEGKEVKKILDKESAFALKESYNRIRSNLLFTAKGEKCPVYGFTSSEQNEGKTLNSVNVAKSLVQLGKKVLLIDADMRNSSVNKLLGIKKTHGLSEYLADLEKKPNCIELDDGLIFLPAGRIPPNPAELLAGKKMDELMESAKEDFDFVIIDLPPVGVVSDALSIVDKVIGYVLVIRANITKNSKEKETVSLLENVDANISGFIFNAVNMKSADYAYGKYGYEYKYGEDGENK